MENKPKFEWQLIHHQDVDGPDPTYGTMTLRAKVFGGWIVKDEEIEYSKQSTIKFAVTRSMVFVPDPSHQWKVERVYDY